MLRSTAPFITLFHYLLFLRLWLYNPAEIIVIQGKRRQQVSTPGRIKATDRAAAGGAADICVSAALEGADGSEQQQQPDTQRVDEATKESSRCRHTRQVSAVTCPSSSRGRLSYHDDGPVDH